MQRGEHMAAGGTATWVEHLAVYRCSKWHKRPRPIAEATVSSWQGGSRTTKVWRLHCAVAAATV